jgi:vacuolar protein sorting-associated protein 33A
LLVKYKTRYRRSNVNGLLIDHIKHFSKTSKVDCWLFFVPERTMICERVLEEEGVKGDITIGDYAMDWIPCEDDLISMELDPSTWKEIYLVM